MPRIWRGIPFGGCYVVSQAPRHHSVGPPSGRDLRCQLIAERKDKSVFGALQPPATTCCPNWKGSEDVIRVL
jgi:hypothetical protein